MVWTDWLHNDSTELNRRQRLNRLTAPLKFNEKVTVSDRAAGLLIGLPITTKYIINNQRILVYLNEQIHSLLQEFLPPTMKDFTTFPNLIGLRSGKFTSNAPHIITSTVTYVAASDPEQFTNLYLAQHRYFQATKKQALELYGLQLRIIPLPPTSTKGLELRTELHSGCTALAK
jgi:hypothetical protein